MNTNRFRKTAVCLALAVVSCLIGNQFLPECYALGWHVLHGRTAHLRSYDGRVYSVKVPVLLIASSDESGWELAVMRKPGDMRARLGDTEWAMMSLSVGPMYSTGEELQKSAPIMKEKLGVVISEAATFSVAGQDVHCFELSHNAATVRNGPVVEIRCAPMSNKRGLSAFYMGSRALVPAFYVLLKDIRRDN